jgi:chaperonin cofactor prefoldin|tara:strand:+ start:930 stop:1145 length:216 start_codon:yes stop_codon:yes gene_type:complete
MTDEKDKIIEDLKVKLDMAGQVKKSEVMLNTDLRETIEKQKLHITTLQKINEDFSNKYATLKVKYDKLLNE